MTPLKETSFVPFAAMVDGRQPLDGGLEGGGSWLVREVPWGYLAGGLVVGAALEGAVLRVVAGGSLDGA